MKRLAVITTVLLLGWSGRAAAQESPQPPPPPPPAPEGGWCPNGVCAGGGRDGAGGRGRHAGLPLEWRRQWDEALTCGPSNTPSPTPDGARYRDQLWDLRINEVLATEPWRCWDPVVEPGGPPEPPLPPAPEEVFDRAGIPPPEVNISPHVRGLVGLETWVWYTQDTEGTAAVDLAGWHAEVTATIVWYEYDLGNGDVVEGERHPTEGYPYTYVYSRHCGCVVVATTWWDGIYTATHPALSQPIVIPLGAREFEGPPLDYDVIEVEAVGGNPDD